MAGQSSWKLIRQLAAPGLCLVLATHAYGVPGAAAVTAARTPRSESSSSAIRRHAAAPGYRRARPHELKQFHAEMARRGWRGAIATIPAAYVQSAGKVLADGGQFATLQGDIDGDRNEEWIIGYHFESQRSTPVVEESDASDLLTLPPLSDDRARIVVFKQDRIGRWRIAWRSPGLGLEFCLPEFNIQEVESGLDRLENLRSPLSLADIDGDETQEIAFHCRSASPQIGALPGVYRYDSSRWMSVAPQSDRFSLVDVDRDGKLEVLTGSRFIGYGTGDDDVPRVWRWTGSRFQEASRDFPRFYAELASRYQAHVRRLEQRHEPFHRAIWERAIQKASSLSG